MTHGLGAPAALALAALGIAVFGLTGCGGADTSPAADSTAADHSGTDALTLDIRIAGASVTPVNARTETRAGMPITLVVDSDAEDELHVHATPEHTFAVHPGEDQRFTFTVDVPGRVDVELHRANLTVTTIYVRP